MYGKNQKCRKVVLKKTTTTLNTSVFRILLAYHKINRYVGKRKRLNYYDLRVIDRKKKCHTAECVLINNFILINLNSLKI